MTAKRTGLMTPKAHDQCPTLCSMFYALPNPQSAFRNPQSTLWLLALTLCAWLFLPVGASNSSALPRLPQTPYLLAHKTVGPVNPQGDSSLERGSRNNHADNGDHDRNPIDASDQLVHCGVAVEPANSPCLRPPAWPYRKPYKGRYSSVPLPNRLLLRPGPNLLQAVPENGKPVGP